MLAVQTCLVLLGSLIPIASSGILTRARLEMVNIIAMRMGFTCVTIVVEEVDRIGLRERKELMKISLPLVIFEMDDIEELFALKGNDDIKCISFVFLEEFRLEKFLDLLIDDFSDQLETTNWFIWINNVNM